MSPDLKNLLLKPIHHISLMTMLSLVLLTVFIITASGAGLFFYDKSISTVLAQKPTPEELIREIVEGTEKELIALKARAKEIINASIKTEPNAFGQQALSNELDNIIDEVRRLTRKQNQFIEQLAKLNPEALQGVNSLRGVSRELAKLNEQLTNVGGVIDGFRDDISFLNTEIKADIKQLSVYLGEDLTQEGSRSNRLLNRLNRITLGKDPKVDELVLRIPADITEVQTLEDRAIRFIGKRTELKKRLSEVNDLYITLSEATRTRGKLGARYVRNLNELLGRSSKFILLPAALLTLCLGQALAEEILRAPILGSELTPEIETLYDRRRAAIVAALKAELENTDLQKEIKILGIRSIELEETLKLLEERLLGTPEGEKGYYEKDRAPLPQ